MFEETPFPEIEVCTVYLEPFLNSYYKEYQNILTVNREPTGPMATYVKRINPPKLSPFMFPSPFDSPFDNCVYAFVRNPHTFTLKNNNPFLNEKDVPSLLGFLKKNGYTVDMDTVKIMHKSGISKRFICSFS
jgi:hypothetical protein